MMRTNRCSCRQTKTLVDYVRAKNPQNLHLLWVPVRGELPENEDPETFLRNPENSVSLEALRNIMEQTRKATSDDSAVYKAALSSGNGSHLGRALKKRFRAFFGPKHAIQETRVNGPFLLAKGAEIVSISDTHAVIRLHWSKDLPLSSDFCLYAKGTYQAIPTLFDLAPARLWERGCFFKGGPWCEYEIWWDKQRREPGAPEGGLSKAHFRQPRQQGKIVEVALPDPADRACPEPAEDPSIPDKGRSRSPEVPDAMATGAAKMLSTPKKKDRRQGIAVRPIGSLGKSAGLSKNGTVRQFQQLFGTIEKMVTAILSDLNSGHPHFDGLKGIAAMVRRGANLTARLAAEQAEKKKIVSGTRGVSGDQKQRRQPLTQGLAKTKGTVLLVDDEEMLVDVGRQMLEAMGYEVIGASKGRDAVKIYQEHRERIQMVILDMVMPDMGGGEVYDKMKAINPEVKVLLSSAYGIDREANAVLAKGCKGFLQKPFSLEQLSGTMRAILDRKDTASHE